MTFATPHAIKRRARHAVEFRVACDVISPLSGKPLAVTIETRRRDGAFQGLLRLRAHSAAGRRLLGALDSKQRLNFLLGGNHYTARVASGGSVVLHAIDVARWIFREATVANNGKFAPSGRGAPKPRALKKSGADHD
jgi:hypothetical protein